MKDASDKFIKKAAKGQLEEIDKDAGRPEPKKALQKRTLRLNTDDTFDKYPNAFGKEAYSPAIKSGNENLDVEVDSSGDDFGDMESHGLKMPKMQKRKK